MLGFDHINFRNQLAKDLRKELDHEYRHKIFQAESQTIRFKKAEKYNKSRGKKIVKNKLKEQEKVLEGAITELNDLGQTNRNYQKKHSDETTAYEFVGKITKVGWLKCCLVVPPYGFKKVLGSAKFDEENVGLFFVKLRFYFLPNLISNYKYKKEIGKYTASFDNRVRKTLSKLPHPVGDKPGLDGAPLMPPREYFLIVGGVIEELKEDAREQLKSLRKN